MTSDLADLAEPPAWFARALAAPVVPRAVSVAGTEIAYRQFGPDRGSGPTGSSGIVLVHGGAAHARWWDHIAPLLATGRGVVAIDLSGHGDSGRNDKYTLDGWAAEVMAVAADAGFTDPPVIVGHSMGGFVALRAAGLYGTELTGIVVIDSPVQDLTPEQQAAREGRAFGPLRVYPSLEAAIARFRPMPDQPTLPYIRAHIAATSIRAVDGGWTWKFDPAVFGRSAATPALLRHLDCRVALFHAEHGIVPPQTTELMYDKLGQLAPVIEIPAAGHHVMLDQPIALVTGIRTLLSDWDHSLPAPPSLRLATSQAPAMRSAALDRTGTRAQVSLNDKLNKNLAMPTAPARSARDRASAAPKHAAPKSAAKSAAPKSAAPEPAAQTPAAPNRPASTSGADPISEFFASLAAPGQIATFAGESATLRFDVTNGSKLQHWYLTINNGNVAVTSDTSAAEAVIRIERPNLEDIVTGRLNAQAAMLRGLLTCEGNMAALMMFQRCLPGPSGSTGRVAPISSQTVMAQRRPM